LNGAVNIEQLTIKKNRANYWKTATKGKYAFKCDLKRLHFLKKLKNFFWYIMLL
jgi:hypothetical protein